MSRVLKFKIIFAFASFLVFMLLLQMSPVVGSQVAIQQLNDQYTASLSLQFWMFFKRNWFVIYVALLFLTFYSEIVRLFKRKPSKNM